MCSRGKDSERRGATEQTLGRKSNAVSEASHVRWRLLSTYTVANRARIEDRIRSVPCRSFGDSILFQCDRGFTCFATPGDRQAPTGSHVLGPNLMVTTATFPICTGSAEGMDTVLSH